MYQGVIVGLGNPGPTYAHTRHNCGYDLLDLLLAYAEREGHVEEQSGAKFCAKLWKLELPSLGSNFLCAKPLTFMNESGRAVQAILAWHKLEVKKLLVLHDELDLPVGQLRFKFAGGNAGHNGLKSISTQLGSNDFYRLRLGIGRPKEKANVINWVLSKPVAEEKEHLEQALHSALQIILTFYQDGLEAAVSAARALKI